MFCLGCGADCADAQICPVCGGEVPAPPLGRLEGVDGYIDMGLYTMTLCKQTPSGVVECVVSYREITYVTLRQASDGQYGYLCVGSGKRQPAVNNEWDAMACEAAIVFAPQENQAFCELYTYLSAFTQYARRRLAEKNGDICPHCGSKSVMRRCMCVPVFVCLDNSFICNSCGYEWDT